MKVLLAAVNAKYIHSNLAVYSLRAYAHRYRKEIRIAEYTINQQVDEILKDIYKCRPDVICFSCYLWNITCVEQLLEEVPKILPDTEIWVGGPEVSYDAQQVLSRNPGVSGVMRGEGEETFLELMDVWHQKICRQDLETEDLYAVVRGITYRGKGREIKENPGRPVMDLSRIPFPYKDLADDTGDDDSSFPAGESVPFRNRIIYYESSRGCPFSCSYCLSSVDKCLRFRDIRLVKKELQFFIDHEVPQVKFVDRTFNCRHDHAMAVWEYIKEHDRGITNFHFEVAADLLNDEEIELIRSMRPGLIQLEIGVQSANEQTIREICRKMDLEKVRAVVGKIRKQGNIHQHLDLIAGLPYEDYDSFGRSFDTVYAMRPEQLQLGFLKVLKGSQMYEKAGEYGLLYQTRPPYEVLSTKWLSYADVIRLKAVEEMVEVYYNSGQFRNTMEYLEQDFSSAFAMYEALAAYYEEKGFFRASHSRIARYEILDCFITDRVMGDAGQPEDVQMPVAEKRRTFRERLTLDLYLRDNVRNRPAFLGAESVSSDEAAAFYREEDRARRYVRDYEGYDRRQIRRMTHLERIGGLLVLFDYRHRDPLTGNARVYRIDDLTEVNSQKGNVR